MPDMLSSQDYNLVMTTLESYYSEPFSNKKTLLSHHKKAGKIPKLYAEPKEASKVAQHTKLYLERTTSTDAEDYIY